jgi:hypothetical protein
MKGRMLTPSHGFLEIYSKENQDVFVCKIE